MPGLLDWQDPAQAGNLGLAAGLLGRSGPQRQPVSFGQSLSAGLLTSQQMQLAAQQAMNRSGLADAQTKQLLLENEALQRNLNAPPADMYKTVGNSLVRIPGSGGPIGSVFDAPAESGLKPLGGVPGLFSTPTGKIIDSTGRELSPPEVQNYAMSLRKAGASNATAISYGAPVPGINPATGQPELYQPSKTGGMQPTGIKVPNTQIDKSYAPQYTEWTTGGAADSYKNISQLGTVIQALKTEQGITGPGVGAIPDAALPFVNPRAAAMKERVQEVVQRNLRLILGAQFTEKEGTKLIERAYNPSLGPVENEQRLTRLLTQMALAAKSKDDAAKYFSEKGTLQGWKGKLPSMSDFQSIEFDAPATNPVGGNEGWRIVK